MVLKFEVPLRLKALEILSHESKISSRIELYYIPYQNPELGSYGQAEEVLRIGSFGFENPYYRPGEKPSREMKTVHLQDIYTQFVKLVIYQPYENSNNVFHQVGIVSISCIGSMLDAYENAVIQD